MTIGPTMARPSGLLFANAECEQGLPSETFRILQPQPLGVPTMTGHQVNSLVSDLVEMAKAVERVPQLEDEVRHLTEALHNTNMSKVDMHAELEQSRSYAAILEQKLHDAEVARDDAELRFLECDDAKTTLVRVLDGLGKDILGVLQAVAPIPTPTTQTFIDKPWVDDNLPMLTAKEGRKLEAETPVNPDWINGPPIVHPNAPTEVSPSMMEAVTVDAPLVGQSEVDPTHETTPPTPSTASVLDAAETSTEGVSVSSDPTSLPVASNAVIGDGVSNTTTASDTVGETPPNPFVPPTSPSTSPSAPSSAAIIEGSVKPDPTVSETKTTGTMGETGTPVSTDEHNDYYGWHPANDRADTSSR